MTHHRGFVLIQVMLVFATLVIIAAKLQVDQRVHIERTFQSLFLSQAQTYIDSAEDLAIVGLTLDKSNTSTDHLHELWNTANGAFPIDEQWFIFTELNDLQGRFNLNWLSKETTARADAREALKKLLAILNADPNIAEELYKWFDSESGVEYLYSDLDPSYGPSFIPMSDVSELLLLKSVNHETYQQLAPYFSALPATSALNINTAPVEVIQSVASFIDSDSAARLVDSRKVEGYSSVDDFLKDPIFTNNAKTKLTLNQLTVNSDWFELYTAVTFIDKTYSQRSVLYRGANRVSLILRDQAAKDANPIPGDPIKVNHALNSEADALVNQ